MSHAPSSAQDVCPEWCVADHTRQVHPDDELHWGELGKVRAVELSTAADGFDPYERRLQIDVGVERGFTADTAYLSMVVDELRSRSFLITADSARRLSHALGLAATAAGA